METEHQLHRTAGISVVDRDQGKTQEEAGELETLVVQGCATSYICLDKELDYTGAGRRRRTGLHVSSQDNEASSDGLGEGYKRVRLD